MSASCESACAASASVSRNSHRRPEKELVTLSAGRDPPLSPSGRMAAKMARLDPAHGARARTHENARGGHKRPVAMYAVEHRAVGDTGGGEHRIAAGEIGERVFALQIGDAETRRTHALLIIAED